MGLEWEKRAKDIILEAQKISCNDHAKKGIGKAFLIAALNLSLPVNQTTLYHYPAFYNMHHALELLVKGVFLITNKSHKIYFLLDSNQNVVNNFFTNKELEDLRFSDGLNSNVGQLRYFTGSHKQFDWDVFLRLGDICLRLLKKRV